MFILLPVALIFSGAACLVFFWAARAGQFDDLETPGLRILHEDDEPSSARGERIETPPRQPPRHRVP